MASAVACWFWLVYLRRTSHGISVEVEPDWWVEGRLFYSAWVRYLLL